MAWQVAVPAALGAAGCMAMAAALQHHSARTTPEAKMLGLRQLARFSRSLVAHRLWQVALVIQVGGLVLHALALHYGALTAIQPLLIIGVVFALPLNRLLGREPVTRWEIGWAVALVGGLAAFLVSADPARTQAIAGGSGFRLDAVALGTAAVVTICLLVSRRAGPAWAAALLGVAAGTAYTTQALFLQATAAAAGHGLTALLDSTAVYGLLIFGGGGFVLTQLAFRAGPLSASLPAITVTNPLGGVLLGVLVNNERVRTGPAAVLIEVAGLLVVTVAGIALARSQYRSGGGRPRRPGGRGSWLESAGGWRG